MPDWTLVYDTYDPQQQGHREALCALGNGYVCARGAFPWVEADDRHYPGTYLAGGYNRLRTPMAGREIENEDLVNLPNWLPLTFRIDGGRWFNLNAVTLEEFRQELHLEQGILRFLLTVTDEDGRRTRVEVDRCVSMADPHLLVQRLRLVAENWSERVEVKSALDGRVINAGVPRYRSLACSHLEPRAAGLPASPDGRERFMALTVETNQSHLRIGLAARTRLVLDSQLQDLTPAGHHQPGLTEQRFVVEMSQGQTLDVEKVVRLHTSRDDAISEPGLAAREVLGAMPTLPEILEAHVRAWQHLWHRCDIRIDGDNRTQMILRLHIFHLLQTLSPNTVPLDAGVPARGWHGEAYRGHVFWDEVFILPFLNHRLPEVSRSSLRYRYARLGAARRAARTAGHSGAMYPWQSGSDGREETQQLHLNPRSGRWLPDNTWQQRHVSLAIAYNIWRYYTVTGERGFLEVMGAEMILEIARFFASLAEYNPRTERYDIHRVMGPDEYHDGYPDATEPGLTNNAYTNVLTAWLMETAERVLAEMAPPRRAELLERLQITDEERTHWEALSRRLTVPFHDDGRVISQFEGYGDLKEFDWASYREKYGDIQRLDRILESEGRSANDYKVSKQADVLMLFYLFSRPRLQEIFERLGYDLTETLWQDTIAYYLERTSHGSTLSYVVHSWLLARATPEAAWERFQHALSSDLDDVQGGTTAEGIHLGAMAGTVDLVQRCFTGLDIRDGCLHLDPALSTHIREMHLRLTYKHTWLDLTVNHRTLRVAVEETMAPAVPVCVAGICRALEPGESYTFALDTVPPDAG